MKSSNEMYLYGFNQKKFAGIRTISLLVFVAICGILYYLFFKESNPLGKTFIGDIFNHVIGNIGNVTLLGVFYLAFFGGLFFLTVPLEVTFIFALGRHNDFLVLLIMLSGIALSYTINYVLGYRFSSVGRKLISVKQFYKLKALVNRRGNIAIVIFNLIGTGSQAVTFIMGVFRYNKMRLLLFTAAGQVTRYIVIILIMNFGSSILG